MRVFACLIVSFAVLAFSLPLLEAQVAPKIEIKIDPKSDPKAPKLIINFAQKDEKKDDKKPVEKAPEDKKDDPKVDPKTETKGDPKETKKVPVVRADEGVVLAAPRYLVKVKDLKPESKEIVVVFIDSNKQQEYVTWEIAQNQAFASNPKSKTPDSFKKYVAERNAKLQERFSGDVKTITVGDAVRIRSMFVFPQFDVNGKEKKLSGADLAKLKSPRLPGFNADFSNLREGQLVELYIVKQAPPKKNPDPPAKTPKFIGADPTLNVPAVDGGKLEVHMILVQAAN